MKNMIRIKSQVLDPHANRNKCKLIWDSSSISALNKGHASSINRGHASQKKQGQSVGLSSQKRQSQPANPRRNSLVASRISFYEECREPVAKPQTAQVRLAFDEKAPTTYEYEAEETALENYLQEHPEERDEALKQEMEESGASASSTANLMNDTPMAPEPEPASMKSNTVIGMSTGALTNYKSKMQVQDFQFGVSQEPEFFSLSDVTNDETNEDNMQLLPADDNELDTFSAETGKADLLF